MTDEVGRQLRQAFLEMLKSIGTECDVRGELRRAVKQTKIKEGYVVFQAHCRRARGEQLFLPSIRPVRAREYPA